MLNKNNFLKFVLLIGDIFLMYAALLLTLALRYGDFSFLPGPQTRIFLWHFSFIYLFWLLFLFVLDFYEIPPFKKVFDFFSNLIIFLFLAGALGVTYFYLRPQPIIAPKTILVLDVLIFGAFLCSWRYLFSQVLRLQNFKEKIIIVGFRADLKELIPDFLSRAGYEISAFFNPQPSTDQKFNSISNFAKYGIISDISKLNDVVERESPSSVVLAFNLHENEKLIQQIFSNLPLKLNFVSFTDFYESLTQKVPVGAINEIWFLENFSRVERKIDQFFKRAFDVFFSLIGLLIIAIFFPFVALAIKIDSPDPIFYLQKRVGKDGKVFTIYKFRTMKVGAEKKGPQWASPDDPRITRVGRVLRATYLDEFPQFYNIFKGDISFVGPRPERPEFVEQLKKEIPYYDIRHLIKPGFTGWAQIEYHYGASVEEAKEKLQYDLYYIKNRSFFWDLGIILKTISIIFRQ